jgi:hypothetical protein
VVREKLTPVFLPIHAGQVQKQVLDGEILGQRRLYIGVGKAIRSSTATVRTTPK